VGDYTVLYALLGTVLSSLCCSPCAWVVPWGTPHVGCTALDPLQAMVLTRGFDWLSALARCFDLYYLHWPDASILTTSTACCRG
jgi:hypothetical protein